MIKATVSTMIIATVSTTIIATVSTMIKWIKRLSGFPFNHQGNHPRIFANYIIIY